MTLSVIRTMEEKAESMRSSVACLHRDAKVHNTSMPKCCPSEMSVVMMTITAHPNAAVPIKRAALTEHLDGKQFKGLRLKPVKESKRAGVRQRGSFYNSVSLQYVNGCGNNKCIKVFTNSKLHVTGCKTVDEFIETSQRVCWMLSDVTLKPLHVVDFDVNMIVVQFYINAALDIGDLCNILKGTQYSRQVLSACYNPDRNNGLVIKHRFEELGSHLATEMRTDTVSVEAGRERAITIIVYRKGCVRLCGLRTHMEALPSYRFITRVIDSAWSSIATAK